MIVGERDLGQNPHHCESRRTNREQPPRSAGACIGFWDFTCATQGTFELVCTERPRQAIDIAAGAAGFETVLAVGGDGIVHEGRKRPDAHSRRRPPRAGGRSRGVGKRLRTHPGYARGARATTTWRCCFLANGTPWTWACSILRAQAATFGANILSRRSRLAWTPPSHWERSICASARASRATRFYLLSGLRAIALDYRDFPASVAFDGAPTERMHPLTFAVQIGPTYGSGFKICPDADPADGMFDICYVSGPMLRLFAPSLLMAAKTGRHVHNRRAHLKRVRSVSLFLRGTGCLPRTGRRRENRGEPRHGEHRAPGAYRARSVAVGESGG